MRFVFFLLALGIAAIYVLAASNAVEFQNQTLERTDTVERVVCKPAFYPERLTAYLQHGWDEIKNTAASLSRTRANP